MTTAANVMAIDGPVGVGKSAVARRVAARLGWAFLDTGAMYRSVVLQYLRLPENERTNERLGEIARQMDLDLRADGTVWLDGEDITTAIRDELISRNVYRAADDRAVREALVAQQHRIGLAHPSVLEGRDTTTVVFPDARWKIYLDASRAVRVQRRCDQLAAAGHTVDRAEVERALVERDTRDRAREWGALRLGPDALVVDTTDLPEDHVVELLCGLVGTAR